MHEMPTPFSRDGFRICIVGATGAVGRELLDILIERGFPVSAFVLVASAKSAGSVVEIRNIEHTVLDLLEYDFADIDIAFFSAGTKTSQQHAARAAESGALVIDNTNAFRMDHESALIVPQVNGQRLTERPANGIIANPNCSTIQMVRVLSPLNDLFGLETLHCTTYQAASGGGQAGIEELCGGLLSDLTDSEPVENRKFPAPLALNVVPQIDVFQPDGFTLEEQKMRQETRRILDCSSLPIFPVAVRVPVRNCHSEALIMQFSNPVDLEEAQKALREAPEIVVYPKERYPVPKDVSGDDGVHVGRMHTDPENDKILYAWVVADNLRVGAALNACQIAEMAVSNGLVRSSERKDAASGLGQRMLEGHAL